jgi:chemotaxis response regulator CheB
VREYPAGADLLKDVEHAAVDSLVLDERMPAMSGLDAIARLRELNISVPTMLMDKPPHACAAGTGEACRRLRRGEAAARRCPHRVDSQGIFPCNQYRLTIAYPARLKAK